MKELVKERKRILASCDNKPNEELSEALLRIDQELKRNAVLSHFRNNNTIDELLRFEARYGGVEKLERKFLSLQRATGNLIAYLNKKKTVHIADHYVEKLIKVYDKS